MSSLMQSGTRNRSMPRLGGSRCVLRAHSNRLFLIRRLHATPTPSLLQCFAASLLLPVTTCPRLQPALPFFMSSARRRMGPARAFVLAATAHCASAAFCPTEPDVCLTSIADGFKDGHFYSSLGWASWFGERVLGTDSRQESICTPENWELRDKCAMKCPLRLELAQPGGAADLMVCLVDNGFMPLVDAGHLHGDHAENDKVRPLVAVGDSMYDQRRMGCKPEDFEGRDFTASIAVVVRGGCAFTQKVLHAKNHGATSVVVVNSAGHSPALFSNAAAMGGDSSVIGDDNGQPLALMAPRHHGLPLFRELDAQRGSATTVTGALKISCAASFFSNRFDNDPRFVGDSAAAAAVQTCPYAPVMSACAREQDPERRLCEVCPVEVTHRATNVTLCLYNNALLPRRARTLVQLSTSLPTTMGEGDAVLMMDAGPAGGCARADYLGLAGKTVVMPFPASCLPVEAVLNAQGSGVVGVWFYSVSPVYGVRAETVDGMSREILIPVHSIADADREVLDRLRLLVNETVGGAHVLPALALVAGAVRDAAADSPSAVALERAEVAVEVVEELPTSFEWTPGVYVCLCTAIGLTGALLERMMAGQGQACPPKLDDVASSPFTLSLSTATVLLSVSLLSAVAATAFTMAHVSGVSSFDDAVLRGRDAVNDTFTSALVSTSAIAKEARLRAISEVKVSVDRVLRQGVQKVEWAANLYGRGDTSWERFDSKFEDFVSTAFGFEPRWRPYIFMDNGFYASHMTDPSIDPDGSFYGAMKTDSRPDEIRQDGVTGPPNVTKTGFGYGCQMYAYSPATKTITEGTEYYGATSGLYTGTSPFDMLGAGLGNPLLMGRGGNEWHVSARSRVTWDRVAWMYNRPGLSIFAPILDANMEQIGTAEARTRLLDIQSLLKSEVQGSNLSMALFDLDSYELRAVSMLQGVQDRTDHVTSIEAISGNPDWVSDVFDKVDTLHEALDKDYLRALGGLLQHHNVSSSTVADSDGLLLSADFDERDYYSPPLHSPRDLLQVSVDQETARPVDVSDNAHDVSFTGFTKFDHDAQRTVLAMEGGVMLVSTLLTIKAKRVSDTLYQSDTGLRSNNSLFAEIKSVSPTPCVARTVAGYMGPYNECLVHPWAFDWPFSVTVRVRPAVGYAGDTTKNTPVLFSSGHHDESARLFANGVFWLGGPKKIICMTPPVPGGLKPEVWATVTVVVRNRAVYNEAGAKDWSGTGCAVYIDGRLVTSEGLRMKGGWMNYFPRPMRFAEGLEGSLDYAGLEGYALSDAQVEKLHHRLSAAGTRRGRIAHEHAVPSRRWLADVSSLALPGSTTRWGIAAMTPRDDIMGDVDRIHAATRQSLAAHEKNNNTRLRQRTGEGVLVLLVVGLLSITIFVVFNGLITAPFRDITVAIYEAATMNVEAVEQKPSFLDEVNTLHVALAVMMRNLKEIRSYIPQSVLVQTSDEVPGWGGDESDSDVSVANSCSRTTHSTVTSSSQISSVSSVGVIRRGFVSAVGLALMRRKTTLLMVNVVGFHDIAAQCTSHWLLELHGQLCEAVVRVLAASGGVTEFFSGDRFLGSFNASKLCSSHRAAGPKTVVAIREAVGRICCQPSDGAAGPSPRAPGAEIRPAQKDKESPPSPFLQTTAACTCVLGRMGNMGCESLKKFTFISPGFTLLCAMERYARRWGFAEVLIDEELQFEAVRVALTRAVLPVTIPKLRVAEIRLFLLIPRATAAGNDEWMYEIEASELSNPFTVWNELVLAVSRGAWSEAHTLLEKVDIPETDPMRAQVTDAVRRNEWAPSVIEYH
eukprot:TRINITY_DN1529_c0_g5_i2.p1 TRINITY_DN1529_c0_g5~~TRINITY_DN1529_c0_g5_i2.p1  ORF type:complete len:1784 (+),score=364.25 TRINITY_DN1529_c0_g5_i2:1332-6683(+)